MKNLHYFIIFLAFVACSDPVEVDNIVTKGPRNLSIHITETSNGDYSTNFLAAQKAGMDVVPLTFYWSDLENSQGFTSDLLAVANSYYSENNMPVSLNISPIAALNKSFPGDLAGLSFGDDLVITRFKALLDMVHNNLPDAVINNLLLGNEVDLYLNNHESEWPEFKNFYSQALTHAKSLWGNDLKVGVEITFSTLTGIAKENTRTLNEHSDFIAFTYYPLNADFTMQEPSVVFDDIRQVVDLYPDKLLFLEECGYASGEICNSSLAKQEQFVENMFDVWDEYPYQIVFIGFLWLNDLSEETASVYVDLYGMKGHPHELSFKEYLRTTGLRTYNGEPKPAFEIFNINSYLRGW